MKFNTREEKEEEEKSLRRPLFTSGLLCFPFSSLSFRAEALLFSFPYAFARARAQKKHDMFLPKQEHEKTCLKTKENQYNQEETRSKEEIRLPST